MATDPGPQPPRRKRLKASDVKYLVFEGGGGKGFAYLGALQALEELKILASIAPANKGPASADGLRHARLDFRKLHGIGGASAGAITAFLVSIGYTSAELATLMNDKEKFLAFFDGGFNDAANSAATRLSPVLGGPYSWVEDTVAETREKERLRYAEIYAGLQAKVAQWESTTAHVLPAWVGDSISSFDGLLEKYRHVAPFDRLITHWKDFAVNLDRDMGLFAGASARDLFDTLLSARMPPDASGKPQKNISFEAHYQHFRVELLVMGTNIATGKSQVFSHIDTPWMPVADAIRISMGIPVVFKPVFIRKNHPLARDHPELVGCWVDGGLLNNIPFREFDDRPGRNPKTLALRLEIEPDPVDIRSFEDFMKEYLKLAAFGPGESYITAAHAFQTVVLDTTGLSLLDFGPPQAVKKVVQAAKKTTQKYFTGDPAAPSYTVRVSP